jgi:MYXO-CTERM domain-containing protein
MKTILSIAAIAAISSSASAALVAAWDFQTTTNGGTAIAASPNTQTAFIANFGAGSLYLNGTNGASSFTVGGSATEVNAFGGTAINADAGIGMSTVTTSPSALAIAGGTLSGGVYSANGKSMAFVLNLTGLQNLTVSLAAQRTGTGFTSQVWETSTDGTNWSSWGSFVSGTAAGTLASSFATSGVLSLAGTSALDNAATAYIRVTFTGATAASGNNRLDNIIFNADAIPTPGSLALLGLAGLVMRRRR